jgi:hypothetical protein
MAYTVTISKYFDSFYAQRVTEAAAGVTQNIATLSLFVKAIQSDGSTLPSSLNWNITRVTNTSEPVSNDWSTSSGSVTLTGNATQVDNGGAFGNATVADPLQAILVGDLVDETYLGGEQFSVNVFATAGTILATHLITLYDLDQSVSVAYSGSIGTNDSGALGSGTETTDPTNINLAITQNHVSGAVPSNRLQWLKDGSVISGATWPSVINQTANNYLTSFPAYGQSSNYKIRVNNGFTWYDAGSIDVRRGMKKSISNGANVVDENVTGDVTVGFGFAQLGAGYLFQIAQSDSSITNPFTQTLNWTTPSNATLSSHNFTQPRGTSRKYWSRWVDDIGGQWIGSTTGNPNGIGAVSEFVPSIPSGLSVSFNTAGTQATVSATVPSSDSVTSIYYYMSTSPAQPVWQATTTSQTAPASHWQAGTTFTTTPGTAYYFYALGWTHNNPGRDGAAITSYISGSAPSGSGGGTGSVNDYGLQVRNAAGTLIVDNTSRLARVHLRGVVSISKNSTASVTVTGMGNDDTWTVLFTTPLIYLIEIEVTATKSTNSLTFSYTVGNTFGYSANAPASLNIKYIVLRT